MDSLLIAKVLAPKTNGNNAIGTAYPISKNLIITARHVVDFAERDVSKPISVVWTDIVDNNDKPYTVQIPQNNIKFNGNENYDVVLIECAAPPQVISPLLLSERHPVEYEKWKSMGYPQIGKEEDGSRHKVSAMGEIFPPDKCSAILDLESKGDAKAKEGWQGISGAPVFNENNILIAVIVNTPNDINERLRAVSIPYLLKNNEEFKKAVGYSTTQTSTNLLPEIKLNDDFKKQLQQEINAELKRPESHCLNEQLTELFGHEKTASDLITLITDSLLSCPVDEAIRDYLTLATVECLRYQQTSDKLLVRQVAEQILGWLVLSSIDEHQIQTVFPCCKQHDSLFFTLAVDSFAGVEIVLSRRFNHKTAWQNKDSPDPKGIYAIPSQQSWFKWEEEETTRKILIEIWNTVFPSVEAQKNAESKLSETEIKKLDATLRARRIKPKNTEHYYIAFKLPEVDNSFSDSIYQQLLSRLPQMTVVQFGLEGSGSLFLIPEEYVTTEVNEFYRTINA